MSLDAANARLRVVRGTRRVKCDALLDQVDADRLKDLAVQQAIPISRLVRRAVVDFLDRQVQSNSDPLVTPIEILERKWLSNHPREMSTITSMVMGDPAPSRSALENHNGTQLAQRPPQSNPVRTEIVLSRLDIPRSVTATAVENVRGCRFGFGDPKKPDFRFCNAKRRPGSAYCPEHSRLCELRKG